MGRVLEINGPIATVHLPGVLNGEQVRIGRLGLVGEVIGRSGEEAIVQVYESTESVRPGEAAEPLGHPLSVELGPGLLGGIFDGVQRPLDAIYRQSGDLIARGLSVPALDRARRWSFTPEPGLGPGMRIAGGALLGRVPETRTIEHRVLVPPDASGELIALAAAGEYGVDDVVARVRGPDGAVAELKLHQRWPVRTPRPYRARDHASAPLITGQRVLDTFFPLLKGARPRCPGRSAPARPWCSTRSRAGRTPRS